MSARRKKRPLAPAKHPGTPRPTPAIDLGPHRPATHGDILRTVAALVDSAEQLKSDATFIGELAAEVTGDSHPDELEHAAAGPRAVVESAVLTITSIANGAGRLTGIAAARTNAE
jgi:hypothetical protein